jgi:predicted MPP superfamily phosphohydrolase
VKIIGRVQDDSGKGVGGVLVSDGEDIAITDQGGSYSLETDARAGPMIFISVPDCYRCPGGFFGKPSAGGVLGFQLTRRTKETWFSLAQITDTHVSCGENATRTWMRDVLPLDLKTIVESDGPDLIVATGDLTNRGKVPQLERYRAAVSECPVPVISVFGGHDGNEERLGGQPGGTFTRNYEEVLGPTCYSFDRGGYHFVAYANEDYFFSAQDRERKERWLFKDLGLQPSSEGIVMMMHVPPPSAFLDRIASFPVKLVLCGHWHSSKVYSYRGILVAASPPTSYGGIDTTPRGHRLVSFSGKGFEVSLTPLRAPNPSVTEDEKTHSPGGCLEVLWTRQLPVPLHRASPVPSGSSIFVSLADENDGRHSGVCALDTQTGELIWTTRMGTSVKNGVGIPNNDRGVPEGEHCAALSVTGKVHLLDQATGGVIWRSDLPGFPDRWIYTTPLVAHGTVYAGAKWGYQDRGQ